MSTTACASFKPHMWQKTKCADCGKLQTAHEGGGAAAAETPATPAPASTSPVKKSTPTPAPSTASTTTSAAAVALKPTTPATSFTTSSSTPTVAGTTLKPFVSATSSTSTTASSTSSTASPLKPSTPAATPTAAPAPASTPAPAATPTSAPASTTTLSSNTIPIPISPSLTPASGSLLSSHPLLDDTISTSSVSSDLSFDASNITGAFGSDPEPVKETAVVAPIVDTTADLFDPLADDKPTSASTSPSKSSDPVGPLLRRAGSISSTPFVPLEMPSLIPSELDSIESIPLSTSTSTVTTPRAEEKKDEEKKVAKGVTLDAVWTDAVSSTGVDLNAVNSTRLTTPAPTKPTTSPSTEIPSDPDAAALHGMVIPDVMAGIDTSAFDRFEQRRLKFLEIKRKIQEDEQAVVRAVAAEQLKLFYEIEAAIAAQPSSLAKTGEEWHKQQAILAELEYEINEDELAELFAAVQQQEQDAIIAAATSTTPTVVTSTSPTSATSATSPNSDAAWHVRGRSRAPTAAQGNTPLDNQWNTVLSYVSPKAIEKHGVEKLEHLKKMYYSLTEQTEGRDDFMTKSKGTTATPPTTTATSTPAAATSSSSNEKSCEHCSATLPLAALFCMTCGAKQTGPTPPNVAAD